MGDPISNRVQLGEFTIQKKIGEGGMGVVYMARQESLDRTVALKVLLRDFAKNPEFIARFHREARAAASLTHPHVVQIYSVGEERGVPYFAMEFVEGSSLEEMFEEGRRFEVREASEIAGSVARALEAAHEKGIVHRDIKPANVMIDRKGTVKVADFGLAKPVGSTTDITQPGLVVGTPIYMSPEQASGEDVDCRSDIYSLGIVFYEMLVGDVPFRSENVGTVIYKHIYETPMPPSALNTKVPPVIEAAVMKCLAKRPEGRYMHPGELAETLAAFLRGEADTHPTLALSQYQGAPEGAAPSPAAPAAEGAPGPENAGAAPTQAPPRRKRRLWPAVLAASVLLAAGGAALYHFYLSEAFGWPRLLPSPSSPEDPGLTGTAGPRASAFPLASLGKLLPAGARVEMVTPEGTRRSVDPAGAEKLVLPAGRYTLHISRRGYKDLAIEFTLSAERATPALDAETVALEPAAEIAEPYGRAVELLSRPAAGAVEAAAALKELEAVARIDPAFKDATDLRERAQRLLAGTEERWRKEFRAAEDLAGAMKWAEARAIYGRLSKETPLDHPLHEAALRGMDRAIAKLERIEGHKALLKGHIAKGEYARAASVRQQLAAIVTGDEEIQALSGKLARAGEAWKAANEDFRAGRYAEAGRGFEKVLADSPEYGAAARLKERCEDLLKTLSRVERLVKQAEGHLEAGDHARCIEILGKLAPGELGEFAEKAKELRVQAELGLERGRITLQVASFDGFFAKRDLRGLRHGVLDMRPEARKFTDAFERQTQGFFGSGVEIVASRHQIDRMRFERSPEGKMRAAAVEATWRFEFRVPDVARIVSGSAKRVLTLNRVGDRWALGAVAAAGKPEAEPTGTDGSGGRVTGRVQRVSKHTITIDRGTKNGVRVGMVFDLYEESKVVRLPMTGETLFVEERRVASVEVIEVTEGSSRCTLVPGAEPGTGKKLKAGMLAAASRVKRVRRDFPVVTELRAQPAAAAAGERVRVSLEVKPVAGAFVSYRWNASGGVLGSARTGEPRATWTAPPAAGEYTITATVLAPSGREEKRSVTVRSTGPGKAHPKAYSLEGRLGAPGLLRECVDLAFDARGFGYALDRGNRRVLVFDPDLRLLVASENYGRGLDLVRLAVHGGVLYALDARSSSVKRYAVGQQIQFAKESGPPISAYGEGNGRLRKPVDLAVTPAGEICVLDADPDAPSVQVFGAGGAFVHSFGSAGGGVGGLAQPVALAVDLTGAVHVLDAGARRIASFRNGRAVGSFECGTGAAKPVDLAYDAATDNLLVLDAATGRSTAWSTAGRPRGAVLGRKSGLGSLPGATRIAANRCGLVLVASGAGALLDRFTAEGDFLGRMGGEPVSGNCRIAAGPGQRFFALDTRSGTVRSFDRHGWLLTEFGGRGAFRSAADIVCDAKGLVYILDSGACNVRVFDALGRPKGTYGKKGRAPEGLESPLDLATDGAKRLAVLCYRADNSIFHYELGAGTGPRVFPRERNTTSRPRYMAVDASGRTYLVLGREGKVDVWNDRHQKDGTWQTAFRSAADIEWCAGRVLVLDTRAGAVIVCDDGGAELVRVKLPPGSRSPGDLAVSGYGDLCVYDASLRALLRYRPAAGR